MEESKKENLEINDKIPKERRIKTKDTKGELDEDGFFTTPNGSFWDMDGEYFNRYGYDIHGGKYIDKLDYIPGPTWLEEFGCYPEDKDKYQKDDLMDMDDDKDEDLLEGEGGLIDDINKIDIKNDINKDMNTDNNKSKKININKDKKKKKKKKKEESFDEEEWEEIED